MNNLKLRNNNYKKCLEKVGVIAVQKDVRERIGNALSKVFHESCLPGLKSYLGLNTPLDGPPTDLWLSETDLMRGRIILKAPSSNLSETIVSKNDLEAEQSEQKKYVDEKEKSTESMGSKLLGKHCQEEIVQNLKDEFYESLDKELAKLDENLKEKERVEMGQMTKEKEMQIKIELTVLETVNRFTRRFAQELAHEQVYLHKHFWYHVKHLRRTLEKSIRKREVDCQRNIEKLRNELHSENIANVMYILAKERRRCACSKEILSKCFEKRLKKLEKEIEDRGEKLQNKICKIKQAGFRSMARETVMFEIIKHYQRFVYFVLRAVPSQAKYLLGVEQLMIFELTKNMLSRKPGMFKSIDKSDEYSEDLSRCSSSDKDEIYPYKNYISSNHELIDLKDLPEFSFGEKLYAKKEFRKMLSQGLAIADRHKGWNFAVDDFTEPVKHIPDNWSYDNVRGQRKDVVYSKLSFIKEEVIKSTHYHKEQELVEEDEKPTADTEDTLSQHSLDEDSLAPKQKSKLELARDSFLLLKTKKNISKEKQTEESKSAVIKTDSFVISIKKSTDSKVSATKGILTRSVASKIDLPVDSLTLLKSKETIKSAQYGRQIEYPYPNNNKIMVSIGIQCDSISKSVHISHIEIIPRESKKRGSSVMFYTHPNIIPSVSESVSSVKPQPRRTPEEIYARDNETQVLGDTSWTVHLQSQDEFVADRVNSFVQLFKEYPTVGELFKKASNQ